jgi:uncharacterized surface protein with fasciclin (FAS1) repeats
MQSSKSIGENLESSLSHVEFTSLMKSTTLLNMLKAKGVYTVFAPNDEAISAQSIALKKINDEELYDILSYHIVLGKYNIEYLSKMIKHRQNKFVLTTISGKDLYLSLDKNEHICVKDYHNNVSKILVFQDSSTNGMLYETEKLLLPQ